MSQRVGGTQALALSTLPSFAWTHYLASLIIDDLRNLQNEPHQRFQCYSTCQACSADFGCNFERRSWVWSKSPFGRVFAVLAATEPSCDRNFDVACFVRNSSLILATKMATAFAVRMVIVVAG